MRSRTRWVGALALCAAALVLAITLSAGGEGSGKNPLAFSPFDCDETGGGLGACRPLQPAGPADETRARFVSCRATGPWKVKRGSRERKRVALTFDDGPSPFTRSVLDVLHRHRARATFFVVGSMVVPGRRHMLREILEGGNEIGNHSFSHGFLTRRGAKATHELRETNAAIRAATGFTPCTFRPPYGLVDQRLVRRAHALGMTTVMWTNSSEDYLGEAGAVVAHRALESTRAGSIVLMHDGGGYTRIPTVHALARVLRKLKARGYELVTVSELLGQPVFFER